MQVVTVSTEDPRVTVGQWLFVLNQDVDSVHEDRRLYRVMTVFRNDLFDPEGRAGLIRAYEAREYRTYYTVDQPHRTLRLRKAGSSLFDEHGREYEHFMVRGPIR